MKNPFKFKHGFKSPLKLTDHSPDGFCIVQGCNNKLGDRKNFCRECKKEREKLFKVKYYIEQGWDASKLPGFDSFQKYHERGDSKIPSRPFLPKTKDIPTRLLFSVQHFIQRQKGEQMNNEQNEILRHVAINVSQIENGLMGLKANLEALEESFKAPESPRLPEPMKMIEEITNVRHEQFGRVSNAEFDFVQGVAESMNKWGSLTPKQKSALENTYRSIILGEEISYK